MATTPEIGYALEGYVEGNTAGFWQQQAEETPELMWPLCVPVYRRMHRQDAQITSVMRAVTLPLRRTAWRIDPAGARPEVTEHIANDLGLPIVGQAAQARRRRGRFTWKEHLARALLMYRYGHSAFEQVYRYGEEDKLYHLHKLAERPAETISDFHVDRDGGLVAIDQTGWGPTGPVRIPVSSLVVYVLDREGGDWTGQSLLRPAYKHWLIRDRLLRIQAQSIERNSMGVPIYEAGPNDQPDAIAKGEKIAQSYKAGSASGASTPNGAKLRLAAVEGNLIDPQPAIDYHDAQIGRAALAHFLNLGNQTGSWALGSTFADFFVMSLQTGAELVCDTTQAHVIDDLVDANWGPDEPAPRLVFDEIGSRKDATAAALEILVRAGILTPDHVLEQAARQDYGLPEAPTELEAEAEAAVAPVQLAPVARHRAPVARIERDGALTLW